ncbi:unnamed protein product [Rotaria magnacalcarata]|uniref:Uncharacterized protein n=2 Tax=Rotaria magnacalcarata TaxID=392030 RepID=A0A816L0N0_9BILA|nr:unnamed protein product [Rotaria magnacalcarata]
MISKNYFVIFVISSINLIQCQITNQYDKILSNQPDYIDAKYIPSMLHNDHIYLTIQYKCSSLTPRRISLSINIERTLYRTNLAIFRRYWFCHKSPNVQLRYVRVQLHRSIAYRSDSELKLVSWPIEEGQLKLIMYKNNQENENEMLKKIQYNVRFLPVHKRPSIRSFRWHPLINKTRDSICPAEPEVIRIIEYPLVLTGRAYGKHFVLPTYHDYGLRLERQIRFTKPRFSIIFWLYIDEYYASESLAVHSAILQHLAFNNTYLTPGIFLNREGQIIVNMFGNLYDRMGTGARTIESIAKKDWCRMAFIVNEYKWDVYINCLQTWDKPIIATHTSPIYYFFDDQLGTFIVGGSVLTPSFRGFISQLDIYRRIALTYEQLPKKLNHSFMPYLPSIIQKSSECKRHFNSFTQSREQADLFNKRIQQKFTCDAQPFLLKKPNRQCLLVRTWKHNLSLPAAAFTDVRYRIYRALRRRKVQSMLDVANKLYDLTMKILESDDFDSFCNLIISWSEQAVCYGHPSASSLLATFHRFGLCGLQSNSTRALELLFTGALLNDRISLLALGHRHFYELDGVPIDYDIAYVYYQQMAETSRQELYNPKAGEASMEYVRLTDDKLIGQLTFDKSDSFYWLRHQAKRGVASAQQRLGALMYAGRNGLTRNIQAAVEYFRLGAAQHDPSSHFGYGLALLKGQGTKKNIAKAIQHIEKAVEHGYLGAKVALGYHAYEIERNYTKAAQYWKECFDQTRDANCAHNLGVMWASGRYPPNYVVDHAQAWQYYSFAAQHGQIDSRVVVAQYNARGGHPVIRNPSLAAFWSRNVAEESSSVGSIVRRALEAYQDRRWHSSFVFYMQAALAGIELGYFNAGFLCNELKESLSKKSNDCIEELLNRYLMVHSQNLQIDSYALLNVAEYYQWKKRNFAEAIKLYVQLYRNGDAQGLYHLAQIEETNSNNTIPSSVWVQVGIRFDEKIIANRYRRLQFVYQHCRQLKTAKSDESYIPCTLAYLRISMLILLNEPSKLILTIILMILSILLFIFRT